jgi:cytochrome-b5 reductase
VYAGRGKFSIQAINHSAQKLGMIAGGTGLSPMLQIIRAILSDPEDSTVVHLIFANQTEEDIFMRSVLDDLPRDRFHLWYTLDHPPTGWSYGSGFINAEMCREHLPAPGPDTFYLMCGPPPMIKLAIEPAFQELGISKEQMFVFR